MKAYLRVTTPCALVMALTAATTRALPSPATAPAAGAATELDLVTSGEKAKVAAAASAQAARKAREDLTTLGGERKATQARITQSSKDLKAHASSGTGAAKSYESALKAGKAADPALEKARSELAAAGAAGDAAVKDTKVLRKLEEGNARKLAEVLDAAGAAKAAADSAKSAKERLHKLTSGDGSAAQKSAGDAQGAATSAQTAAGLSPAGYAAKRAKADADAQKVLSDLRVLEQSLAGLKNAAGGTRASPSKPAVLKQCDLRKVDWNKYFPATSEDTGDGTNEYGVVSVEYADLDGDGSVEALVHAMHSYLGLTASQQWELNVMTRDRDCTVSQAGVYTGALCAEMTRSANVLTLNDGCEGFVAEYRLVQGSMKETKRRRQ